LLVVAAVGEGERVEGWLSPLHEALYPAKERYRAAGAAPGCPKFGTRTVLNRPPDQADEKSIRPGLHWSKAGQPVVWFDPEALELDVSKNEGVENEQVLQGSTEQAVEGLRRYREWEAGRAARIEAGSAPRFRVATAERARGVEGISVETITLASAEGRPGGRRVGRVVHDVLQRADRAEEVGELARIWGRRHGATEAEVAGAADAARAALARIASMVPEGARRVREMELMVRLEDGTLVDGRIDFAWSDGERWTVVDYKTDRREKRRVGQLQLYALALERATGLPARGIVLEV
jgi:ATP-dependent exoDNAse (exonuclease V) beta subunit